jgi:hypothetical protein
MFFLVKNYHPIPIRIRSHDPLLQFPQSPLNYLTKIGMKNLFLSRNQGCWSFLNTAYQGGNIPKWPKIYQTFNLKYTKWPKIYHTFHLKYTKWPKIYHTFNLKYTKWPNFQLHTFNTSIVCSRLERFWKRKKIFLFPNVLGYSWRCCNSRSAALAF